MKRDLLLRDELVRICQRIRIQDHQVFFVDDRKYSLGGESVAEEGSATANDKTIWIENLAATIYDEFYVGKFADNETPVGAETPPDDLTTLFHAANDNKDGWDPGWRIYQLGTNGRLFVQKGDRSRAVMAGEYSTYKWPGVAPRASDFVSVRMFAGSTDVQASFFYAFGRTLSDQFDEYAVVRFYFNVTARAAPDLMAALTQVLNRFQIPFKFKSLVKSAMYTRADAAVLYVAKRYYSIVASLIIDLHRDARIQLREGVPLFTKSLIAGVGLAEDLKAGTSFGMHRCTLLAKAIMQAWEDGSSVIDSQLIVIEQEFAANHISLDQAYLNPHSTDIFEQAIFDKELRW